MLVNPIVPQEVAVRLQVCAERQIQTLLRVPEFEFKLGMAAV